MVGGVCGTHLRFGGFGRPYPTVFACQIGSGATNVLPHSAKTLGLLSRVTRRQPHSLRGVGVGACRATNPSAGSSSICPARHCRTHPSIGNRRAERANRRRWSEELGGVSRNEGESSSNLRQSWLLLISLRQDSSGYRVDYIV